MYLPCEHLACIHVSEGEQHNHSIEVSESRRETFVDALIYVMLIATYAILIIQLAHWIRENGSKERP
jgi:hypothetical protein